MKSYDLQQSLSLFLIVILVVNSTEITNQLATYNKAKITENNMLNKKSEVKTAGKEPEMPKKIPREVLFMQKILLRAYGMAEKKEFPRFSEEKSEGTSENKNNISNKLYSNDPNKRVSWKTIKETWHDENSIGVKDAWSNSVFEFKMGENTHYFSAINPVRGGSYWSSTPFLPENEEVKWEAELYKLTRVHAIDFIWAYAPGQFKIQYSQDGNEFIDLIKWRDSIDGAKSGWWERIAPLFRYKYKSFPDRVTFDRPVWALKLRIVMRNPVNIFFGLYKVEIKVRKWLTLIKHNSKDSCEESCWSVNTNHPKEGDEIQNTQCFEQIFTSENRELFLLDPEGIIYHFSTGLCVVSDSDRKLKLEECFHALKKNDGRAMFNFKLDGSIFSENASNECVIVPKSPKVRNLTQGARVEVSSIVGTGDHSGERAVDQNPNTYWASHPGEENALITINLDDWVSSKKVTIKWKYQAKDFDIFALTLEKGWKHMYKITGNKKQENSFNFKLFSIKAIQIKMTKNYKKYMNLPIYGIIDIQIDDGGKPLTRKNCKEVDESNKRFIIDEQYYHLTNSKQGYVKAWNNLTKLYLELRSFSSKIHLNWKNIGPAQKLSIKLDKMQINLKLKLGKILEKLKEYQSSDLPSQNNPKFINIIEKHRFENLFEKKKNEEVIQTNEIGATIYSPVSDCHVIKRINPLRKSGFYWIKPPCAKKPIRVFCDFSIVGKGISIYVFNNDQHPNSILNLEIKTKEDIHYYCGLKGLVPIDVLDKHVMKRIFYVLKIFGWELQKPNAIPLGFDYECELGLCSKEYNSFSSEKSESINDFFLEKTRDLDKINSEDMDTMGLGYSGKGKPYIFNLKNAKVTALICSTNKYGKQGESDALELTCSDTLITKSVFIGANNTSLKVKCPSLCQDTKVNIYGTNFYGKLSSICVAALHSGVINNREGGEFMINLMGSMKNLKGSISKGIESLDLNETSDIIFSLSKSKINCPLDYLKHPKLIKDEKGSSSEIKLPPLNKDKSQIPRIPISRNNSVVGNKPLLPPFMVFPQPTNLAAYNIHRSTKVNDNPPCSINTERGEKWIKYKRNIDLTEFKLYQKYGNYLNVLIRKFYGEFSWARSDGKLSLPTLNKVFKSNHKFYEDLVTLLKKLSFKSEERFIYTKNIGKKLKRRLRKLNRSKEYKMNYERINKDWKVYDSLKSSQNPSKWIKTNENLKGKSAAIVQTSKIYRRRKVASIYYLKYLRFYDFKMNLDVMVRNSGKFGVIFRMKDPFNYYAIEISQKKGHKRLVKVVNGKYNVLEISKDGGIFQGEWFRIQILVKKDEITFKFGEDGTEYDNLPIIFNRLEQTFRRGTVGVFVKNNYAFYFNDLHVMPLTCWTPYEPRPGVVQITDRSNVYDETYVGDWSKKYFLNDPKSKLNGPSVWSFKTDVMDRETVIEQNSSISDKSSKREPSMLILKDKYFKRGYFSVDLAGYDNGRIGVVFKYINPNNYYLFEIGGFTQENRIFEFRKKINGMVKIIKRINSNEELDRKEASKSKAFGYIAYKWYSIKIVVDHSNIKIFYKKQGTPEKLIIQAKDDDLQIGLIGLTTFNTRAVFDNLSLRPIVEDQKFSVSSKDISPSINTDEDIFLYDLGNKEKEEEEESEPNNKSSNKDSGREEPEPNNKSSNKNSGLPVSKKMVKRNKNLMGAAATYMNCLTISSPSQRKNYCNKEYQGIPGLKKKCRKNFCNFCCDRSVSWMHKNHLFSCKRKCNQISQLGNSNKSYQGWKDVCINVAKPRYSVYSYCDEKFKGYISITNCKIDTCRVCCVTYDQVSSQSYSIESLNKCFQKCAKKFVLDASRENS